MAPGDFKDLTKKAASGKILPDKAFNSAKNLEYDRYNRDLALMFNKSFNKKSATHKATGTNSVNQ